MINRQNYKVLALFFIIFVVFLTLPFSQRKEVAALSNSYSMTGGDEFDNAMWNNLAADFVWKEGDTMTGALNMGGFSVTDTAAPGAGDLDSAATVDYVNNAIVLPASNQYGTPMNMVCGQTQTGSTGWQDYSTVGIYTIVYTTDNGQSTGVPNFTAKPFYIVTLDGDDVSYTTGANAVYIPEPFWGGYMAGDELRQFRVYIRTGVSPSVAESRGWRIRWCGYGN